MFETIAQHSFILSDLIKMGVNKEIYLNKTLHSDLNFYNTWLLCDFIKSRRHVFGMFAQLLFDTHLLFNLINPRNFYQFHFFLTFDRKCRRKYDRGFKVLKRRKQTAAGGC